MVLSVRYKLNLITPLIILLSNWTLIFSENTGLEGFQEAIFNNSTNCVDDVCLKEDKYDLKNKNVVNVTSVKTIQNFSDDILTKENSLKDLKNESVSSELNGIFHIFSDVENLTQSYNLTLPSNSNETKFDVKGIFNNSEETSEITTKKSVIKEQTLAPSEFISFTNLTDANDICFCDIKINECDINCCCDSDCSTENWKIFTKCEEYSMKYDFNYCYKKKTLLKVDKTLEVVETGYGLLCLLKDNLQLPYKSRKIIRDLKSFNKIQPKYFYSFNEHKLNLEFQANRYQANGFVWIIQNKELRAFDLLDEKIGGNCLFKKVVRYLKDDVFKCPYSYIPSNVKCGNEEIKTIFQNLESLKIISSPQLVNISMGKNLEKVCKNKSCIEINIHVCVNSANCVTKNESDFSKFDCINNYFIYEIQYKIWHNGTEGIQKVEAFIWIKDLPLTFDGKVLRTFKINFFWSVSKDIVFQRSGNPGYLTGKPILSGRKIYFGNVTKGKKEIIELPLDPKNWLNVLGSEKGLCSNQNRIPVKFRENAQYSCLLPLSKVNFTKEQCGVLQNLIFQLLLGEEIQNITGDIVFNKFVATFGNSLTENSNEWIPVLIDSFPIKSSQVTFKVGHNTLACKNIISDLILDIIYSNVGTFVLPQAKILGVAYHFGKVNDFIFQCSTHGCGNDDLKQHFKLRSVINYIDVTESTKSAFAESLGLEIKLPHDFFYPFFSKGSTTVLFNKFFLLFLCLMKLY